MTNDHDHCHNYDMTIIMTIMIPFREKLFLPLLLDTWLLSPIMKNGEVEPIESVVKRRTKSLLSLKNSLGIFLYKSIIFPFSNFSK